MIVRYNSLNRFETPLFTLCQPGSIYNDGLLTKTIGALIDHEAEEIVFNFNALSELSMRVNLLPKADPDEDNRSRTIFKAIQNRRLIYAEDVGYFVITNVSDGYDGRISYKDITAKSVDVELQQRMAPYIANGTYRFSTDSTKNEKGIFETIVETLPLWTIGHVDESVSSKYRTFEDVDVSMNCLAFLLDKVQDAYECIIVFDIVNRIINVYAQDNYVRQTDIHITKQNLINTIDINENADDIYTAISALGEDDVSIAAVNPTGKNVIYSFDYYLSWMTESLRNKVVAWQDDVSDAFDEHYELSKRFYMDLQSSSNYSQEIEKLNTQITLYKRCRDNIVAQSSTDMVGQFNAAIEASGGTAISIKEEVAQTIAAIDMLIAGCEKDLEDTQSLLDKRNQSLSELKSEIDSIHERLDMSVYFTSEEYEELCLYIYEGSYHDEYVIVTESMSYTERLEQMKILYDRAKSQLDKVSAPTQEFNIDVESFIFMKDFERWSEQLETGCLINVELDTNNVAAIFLSSISVNYDDRSMKLTFGNRYNKFDPKTLFDNVLGRISKSANTLNYIKEAIYPIRNGEFSAIREVLQTSRDLTMSAALASENEDVVIDASGYTGRRINQETGEPDDHQIKIVSNSIVFTEDGWDTCSLALGNIVIDEDTSVYGINAKAIFGDMIIGGGLKIYDRSGNEMLSVIDGLGSRLESAEIKMTGLVAFGDLSTSGKTVIHGGNIQTETLNIGGWKINDSGLIYSDAGDIVKALVSARPQTQNYTVGSHTGKDWTIWTNSNFGVTNAGKMYATGADIMGKITASGGEISGSLTLSGSLIHAHKDGDYAVTLRGVSDTKTQGVFFITDKTSGSNTYPFRVNGDGSFSATKATITGSISATSGTIAGFNIGSTGDSSYGNAISKRVASEDGSASYEVGMKAGTVYNHLAFYAKKSTDNWASSENTFYVRHDGYLYASNANIAGTVKASSGSIGGWSIGGSKLYGKNAISKSAVIGDNEYEVGLRSFADGTTPTLGAAAIYVQSNPKDTAWSTDTRDLKFYVSYGGHLYAKDAEISGKLIAGEYSKIGDFNVDNNSVFSGSWGATPPDVFMCIGSDTPYSLGGSAKINGWAFGAGSDFGVTNAGALYCRSGKIGEWQILEDGLYSGDLVKPSEITSLTTDRHVTAIHPSHIGHHAYIKKEFDAPREEFYVEADWYDICRCVAEWKQTNSLESDANVKNSITTLDSLYETFFDNLSPCKYKYNHGTSNRYHTGFIAQEVVRAAVNAGLTTQDFAGVIHLEEPNANGCNWLLRRDEFVALNTWQIQKTKKRIEELELRIQDLESKLVS